VPLSLVLPRPPTATLFPYTTLFRSLGLGRDPLVLREDPQDLDLRIAGDEEPADGGEQLVDDLVSAARDAGARDALAGRFPAAVDVDLWTQRLEIPAAQRLEEHADEAFVGCFPALGHVVFSPSAVIRPVLWVRRGGVSTPARRGCVPRYPDPERLAPKDGFGPCVSIAADPRRGLRFRGCGSASCVLAAAGFYGRRRARPSRAPGGHRGVLVWFTSSASEPPPRGSRRASRPRASRRRRRSISRAFGARRMPKTGRTASRAPSSATMRGCR